MNDADNEAFGAWTKKVPFQERTPKLAWQAACEWRDSQVMMPKMYVCHKDLHIEGMAPCPHCQIDLYNMPKLPPAAQINQRLAALLEKSLHWLDGLCDAGPLGQQYPSDELTQFVDEIRAALAATQMRGGCIKHLCM